MDKSGGTGHLLAISESNVNSTSNGMVSGNPDQKDCESKRAQQSSYSMPGVLHFLQHECNHYELERAQWEIERAELKARITFLIGERKSQENLKFDLVRRIKMLECALRQERTKTQQLIRYGQSLQNGEILFNHEDEQKLQLSNVESLVPFDIDSILPSPAKKADKQSAELLSNRELTKARETLQYYLQEIGYTDKILSVRSFRVKHLLGLLPNGEDNNESEKVISSEGDRRKATEQALFESEKAILEAADAIKKYREPDPGQSNFSKLCDTSKKTRDDVDCSDSSSGENGGAELDAEAVEVFNEFAFLKNEEINKVDPQSKEPLDAMKERLRNEQERRRQQSFTKVRNISVDAVHGIPPNTVQQQQQLTDIPFEEEKYEGVENASERQQLHWNILYTLRSHYDSIRAMQFHPIEPVLITASEDGTAKLWDLNQSSVAGSKNNSIEGSGKTGQFSQSSAGIVDIEPIYTFRGHRGPILTMDISPMGETCYTAGLDGVICCWTVPSVIGLDVYQNFDPNMLQERLCGHKNAIWSLSFHSSSNRLISASADGTIRIWIVGLADGAMPSPLLKTITEVERPHSIDVVSTESQHLLSACAQSRCHIRDFETGQIVLQFQTHENDGDVQVDVNKILSHPTMPVTIIAGEDRKIRFFDNNTGKLINSTMAHVEGVSTLAIDPNGLYLLSASHDGSVRFWNAEKRICLQEIAAHRKKLGSGVMSVAFHPSRQLISSAGADGLAKVYGTDRGNSNSPHLNNASPPSSSDSSGQSSLVGSPQKHQQNIASSQL